MDKGTTNSGIPVFGEVVKMLDKEEIMQIAVKLQSDRYTKRLDSYQHLIIMLFATLGEFVSLREPFRHGLHGAAQHAVRCQCPPHPGLL